MYPNEIFLGMGMYEIMLVLGFFGALIYLRLFSDRAGFGANMQNLCIGCALAALIGGYGCSVLMQAVYNALESGRFEIVQNTGATFYGGLVGGTGIYILMYFTVGHFVLKPGEAKANFLQLSDIAGGGICLAHAFGRMGCLFAGCCHGRVTDAWYGIYNAYLGQKTVPTQLFEALFLLALCAYLTYRLLCGRHGNMPLYLAMYAVWRFFLEYLRDDDRGETVVSFLSPSQFTAVLLFLAGVGIFVWITVRQRRGKHGA